MTFSDFGARVAPIPGVRLIGVSSAFGGHDGFLGSCYNRRRINHLGCRAASAKMSQYRHRHRHTNNANDRAIM
jgi:hypothetical protein